MANFKQIYGFSEENWIHLTENTVIACTALVLQESVFPLVVFCSELLIFSLSKFRF